MSNYPAQLRRQHQWLSWLCTFGLLLLTACGAGSQSVTPQPTELPASTSVPNSTPTTPVSSPVPVPPGVATRRADATRNALWRERVKTEVALTPAPPRRTPPPPMPTPTWALGSILCSNGAILEPEFYSCWRGEVNGELITVGVGQQSPYSDRSQGLLVVFQGGWMNSSISPAEVYSTPLKLGGMRIVSKEGTRFTITPYDPRNPGPTATPGITFIFDLATRQWVNP